MLVRPDDVDAARSLVGPSVDLVPAGLDDLWTRDTGPVFVTADGARAGVGFTFNGWGGKQEHAQDATVASVVVRRAGVELLTTELVLEGGGIEVDGQGTASIRKVIWLPGIAGRDITDGHTDFYARFAGPGTVVAPQYGDAAADAAARDALQGLFPGREVVQIDIDAIAAGGGGIHCTTQQEPMV